MTCGDTSLLLRSLHHLQYVFLKRHNINVLQSNQLDCILSFIACIYFIYLKLTLLSNINIIKNFDIKHHSFMGVDYHGTLLLNCWLCMVAMVLEPRLLGSVQVAQNYTLMQTLEVCTHWTAPPLYTDHEATEMMYILIHVLVGGALTLCNCSVSNMLASIDCSLVTVMVGIDGGRLHIDHCIESPTGTSCR